LAPRRPNVDDQKVETAAGPLSQANPRNTFFLLKIAVESTSKRECPHPFSKHTTTFAPRLLNNFYFVFILYGV